MSFLIERDNRESTDSFALQSNADLLSINLVAARIARKVRIEDLQKPSLGVGVLFKPASFHHANSSLYISTQFELRISQIGISKDTRELADLLSINCEFETHYTLAEGFEPTDQQIEAFRSGNAIFNSWAHFREYAVSTVSRMGFPMPPIGFLRLIPKLVNEQLKEGEKTEQTPKVRKRRVKLL